jgi:hypothetical protein
MARHHISDKEILAQIPQARHRSAAARTKGLRATSARYDVASGRVVMETTTGHLFGFPAAGVASLRKASVEELKQVELSPSGSGLHWEGLDVDLDVPALIMSVLGRKDKNRELARSAGSVTTERKAAAARANGAKGGRPSVRRFEQTSGKPATKVSEGQPRKFIVAAAKKTKVASLTKSSRVGASKPATFDSAPAKRSRTRE